MGIKFIIQYNLRPMKHWKCLKFHCRLLSKSTTNRFTQRLEDVIQIRDIL